MRRPHARTHTQTNRSGTEAGLASAERCGTGRTHSRPGGDGGGSGGHQSLGRSVGRTAGVRAGRGGGAVVDAQASINIRSIEVSQRRERTNERTRIQPTTHCDRHRQRRRTASCYQSSLVVSCRTTSCRSTVYELSCSHLIAILLPPVHHPQPCTVIIIIISSSSRSTF